jgi:alanyl-tRNA synthetase
MKGSMDTAKHTTRLYWENPYDAEFTATVVDAWQDGGNIYAVLDSTLFYPEGGGQPSDRGTLQVSPGVGFSVGHVFEEGGRIVHLLSPQERIRGSLLEKGLTVRGHIDWARRFDFMQQHTGQHILSRAFEQVYNANTVGFHIGDDYVSIDLDVRSVDEGRVTEVEDLANHIIYSNLPVEVRFHTQDQVPDNIRRRIPTDSGSVRVIYIGDFDTCACGGTHVRATGEIGIIKINRLDRSHGGVRVIFRCGQRALLDLRAKERVLDGVARSLSVGYHDLLNAVTSLSEKASGLEKQLNRLNRQLLEYEIREMAREILAEGVGADGEGDKERLGGERWVIRGRGFAVCKCNGKQPHELRHMARSLGELTGKTVFVVSQDPQFSLVVAFHTPDAGRQSHAPCHRNAAWLVSELGKGWGLKGGGTPQLAQMGSKEPLDVPEERILDDIEGVMDRAKTVTDRPGT